MVNFSLGKNWVAQCGWIWLCTTISILVALTNFWELFWGVMREHYEKVIGTREHSEWIARDFLQNPSFGSTRNPANNITIINDLDDEDMVATLHCICFYNYLSYSTQDIYSYNLNVPVFCHRTLLCLLPSSVHGILLWQLKLKRGVVKKSLICYCTWRLSNVKRFHKKTFWFCTGCYMLK